VGKSVTSTQNKGFSLVLMAQPLFKTNTLCIEHYLCFAICKIVKAFKVHLTS